VPLVLAAAVATVVVIGGVGWLGQRQSQAPAQSPAAGPGASESSSEQEEPPAAQATRTAEVPVYYVGDTAAGPRLFAETHLVDGVSGSDLDAAVQEALASPPIDPDYSTWASADGLSASASSDGTTITIDLSAEVQRPAGMDAETARVSLQSLIWTAGAAADTAAPVRFTVAGQPADRVLGVDTSAPLERAGAESVLATVSVSSPSEGATVPSQFEVRGQAATFEANVVWELKQGDTVVRKGFATAQECCRLSGYTFRVTAPPGDYTLVVRDTDESDGEGIGTSEDTKQISVG
jgi:spore germination protein GerM